MALTVSSFGAEDAGNGYLASSWTICCSHRHKRVDSGAAGWSRWSEGREPEARKLNVPVDARDNKLTAEIGDRHLLRVLMALASSEQGVAFGEESSAVARRVSQPVAKRCPNRETLSEQLGMTGDLSRKIWVKLIEGVLDFERCGS